ncbi:MAG: hypothetical protein ACJ72D_25290 [Marmoricola sp.]
MSAAIGTESDATTAVAGLIRFLETGEVVDGLFAPDVTCDLTLPVWRLQGSTAADLVDLRKAGHPLPGTVHVQRVDPIDSGFVIEFDERWVDAAGERWYSREMIRADVVGSTIVDVSIYCTGDWDEAQQARHAEQVTLVRP